MKKTTLLIFGLILTLSGCKSNVRDSSQPASRRYPIPAEKGCRRCAARQGDHESDGQCRPCGICNQASDGPRPVWMCRGQWWIPVAAKVFGWIAKLNETAHSATLKHFPQLEVQADPDQPFEVSGYATGESINRGYRCGPISTIFTPEKGKVYLAELQFVGGGCELHAYDITQPQERIPVVDSAQSGGFANAVPGCKSATASVNNQPVTTQFSHQVHHAPAFAVSR